MGWACSVVVVLAKTAAAAGPAVQDMDVVHSLVFHGNHSTKGGHGTRWVVMVNMLEKMEAGYT